jgi:hypothetical protein
MNLSAHSIDMSQQNLLYHQISKSLPKGRFTHFVPVNDTLHAMYESYYPIVMNKDTIITGVLSIVTFHNNKFLKMIPVNHKSALSSHDNVYSRFMYHGGIYYITTTPTTASLLNKPFKYISEFTIKNNELVFNKLLPYEVPKIHQKYDLGSHLLGHRQSENYFVNKISNEIYTLNKDEKKILKIEYDFSDFSRIKLLQVNINFGIYDFKVKDKIIYILCRKYEDLYCIVYDLSSDEILYDKLLYQNIDSNMYNFVRHDVIIYYDSKNKSFILKKIDIN